MALCSSNRLAAWRGEKLQHYGATRYQLDFVHWSVAIVLARREGNARRATLLGTTTASLCPTVWRDAQASFRVVSADRFSDIALRR
jgi:hypothetical protein